MKIDYPEELTTQKNSVHSVLLCDVALSNFV
jgi:hypothetical protein